MDRDRSRNLYRLLDEFIRTRDLEPKMLEQKVFVLWREHLSRSKHLAPLAKNTAPISLSNGVLKIYTEYPAYKASLLLNKLKILADLNAELGKPVLTDFRIEIRQVNTAEFHTTEDPPSSPETPEEDSTTGNTHQITPEQLEKIEQALTRVSDPQLKESLWQLFTTQSKDKP
ncbi:DUF721 domain-containing protein [Candidatus Poribacteria bacterium]|nr:DUF721 domain-containing protein [Candidatus Poribacteria bacterium]